MLTALLQVEEPFRQLIVHMINVDPGQYTCLIALKLSNECSVSKHKAESYRSLLNRAVDKGWSSPT